MKKLAYFLLAAALAGSAACSHKVERIDPNKTTDLSGRWNETDAKQVSAEMIKDCLARPWLERFVQQNNRKPVVVVGLITNKTTEHIDEEIFIKEIEKAFINTGMVRVVTAGVQREKLREERADQQKFSSEDTKKAWGKELGADYIMGGNMSSVIDQFKSQKAVFYKVNLDMTDMQSNETVWLGDKEIKKLVTR